MELLYKTDIPNAKQLLSVVSGVVEYAKVYGVDPEAIDIVVVASAKPAHVALYRDTLTDGSITYNIVVAG